MNSNELDEALGRLAGRHMDAPDLREAVWRRIDLERAAESVAGVRGPKGLGALLSLSMAAALLIGIAVQYAGPLPPIGNSQAETAKTLHLDMFVVNASVRPGVTSFNSRP